MNITTVEYRETISFGNYQNATVGAIAEVNDGDRVGEVFNKIKDWVQLELVGRKRHQEDREEEHYQVQRKSDELEAIEVRIAQAAARWEKTKAFLEKHGVDAGRYDDLPF